MYVCIMYNDNFHLGSRMSLTEASKAWQETHKLRVLTRRAANACAVSVCRLLFGAPQLTRAVCSIVLWENMENGAGSPAGDGAAVAGDVKPGRDGGRQ